ncbi:MAG: hypothetical protein WCT04_20770 [Planctomycetota bacterium]
MNKSKPCPSDYRSDMHKTSALGNGSVKSTDREHALPWILECLKTAKFRATPEETLRRHFEEKTYWVPNCRELINEIIGETESYPWLLNTDDEENSATHWEAFLRGKFYPEEDIWDSDFEYLSDSND